jgi:hypothetical protein
MARLSVEVAHFEVGPEYVTLPAEYERYPENVVEATHVGVPPDIASICPPVPFETAETLPVVPRRRPESDAILS